MNALAAVTQVFSPQPSAHSDAPGERSEDARHDGYGFAGAHGAGIATNRADEQLIAMGNMLNDWTAMESSS